MKRGSKQMAAQMVSLLRQVNVWSLERKSVFASAKAAISPLPTQLDPTAILLFAARESGLGNSGMHEAAGDIYRWVAFPFASTSSCRSAAF